jgi:hypothetical protein
MWRNLRQGRADDTCAINRVNAYDIRKIVLELPIGRFREKSQGKSTRGPTRSCPRCRRNTGILHALPALPPPLRRTRCRSKRSCVVSAIAGSLSVGSFGRALERHLPWLDAQWSSGCRNGVDLWRRLKEQGFRGSLRVVAEWATWRRRAEKADAENLQRIPSSRTIARLMTIGRNNTWQRGSKQHARAW